MSSTRDEEIVQEFPNFIRVYRDGRVERLAGTDTVPPSTNPETGVQSKDVVIDPETGLSARLYIPKTPNPHHKLPLLVYFHGGAFCVETAFSPSYHNYLNSLTSKANVAVVSVDYRRAPEHPLPIPYDDSWAAVKWVASHSTANGGEAPASAPLPQPPAKKVIKKTSAKTSEKKGKTVEVATEVPLDPAVEKL